MIFNKIINKLRPKEKFIGLTTVSAIESDIKWVLDENGLQKITDLRTEEEPVKLLHLLERPKLNLNPADIDFAITRIKKRIKFMQQYEYPCENEKRILDMLVARKLFPNVADIFHWKTTTESKIRELTTNYKLKHDNIINFIRSIPDKAINEMEQYCLAYKKVRKDKPEFSIIAPAGSFKYKTKDPILLAKSPFGDYYYILCAWDKEVDIVDELLEEEEIVLEGKA